MESRKIISFGRSSFVVSIPKAWVVRNSLKKGSQVFLEEEFDSIKLTPKNDTVAKGKQKVMDASNRSIDILKSMIISAYLNNYGTIEVKNLPRKDHVEIKDFFHSLIGIEIIEETGSSIIAKDLLNITELSMESIIRRMDAILRSMLEETLNYDDSTVAHRDLDINRMAYLGLRALRSMVEMPSLLKLFNLMPMDIVLSWQIVVQLERIGDYAKKIAKAMRKSGQNKKFEDVFTKHIILLYQSAMKAYFNRDREACFVIETSTRTALSQCDGLVNDSTAMAIVSEKLKGIIYCIRDIARTVMESD